jgi:hypothetical protein
MKSMNISPISILTIITIMQAKYQTKDLKNHFNYLYPIQRELCE